MTKRECAVLLCLRPPVLVSLVLVFFSVPCCSAQPEAPQQAKKVEEAPALDFASTSTLVTVPVLVRSRNGELVRRLQANDFALEDNHLPQKIEVEQQRQSIALLVLMQTGSDVPLDLSSYRSFEAALDSVIGRNGNGRSQKSSAGDKVGLITFNDRTRQVWNFPERFDGVKHALRDQPLTGHPDKSDSNDVVLLDALHCGLAMMRQQPRALRRVILLLSEPADRGSRTSPQLLLKELGESNTTIYSVTYQPSKTLNPDFRERLRRQQPPQPDLQSLTGLTAAPLDIPSCGQDPASRTYKSQDEEQKVPVLVHTTYDAAWHDLLKDTAKAAATISGGEQISFKDRDDLENKLEVIAHDFEDSYMLTFRPSSAEPGFHALRVSLTARSKYAVAARTSYWAEKDAKP